MLFVLQSSLSCSQQSVHLAAWVEIGLMHPAMKFLANRKPATTKNLLFFPCIFPLYFALNFTWQWFFMSFFMRFWFSTITSFSRHLVSSVGQILEKSSFIYSTLNETSLHPKCCNLSYTTMAKVRSLLHQTLFKKINFN